MPLSAPSQQKPECITFEDVIRASCFPSLGEQRTLRIECKPFCNFWRVYVDGCCFFVREPLDLDCYSISPQAGMKKKNDRRWFRTVISWINRLAIITCRGFGGWKVNEVHDSTAVRIEMSAENVNRHSGSDWAVSPHCTSAALGVQSVLGVDDFLRPS